MNLGVIHSLYKNRTNSKRTIDLVRYFIKLKIGELTGNIYKSNYKKVKFDENFLIQGEAIIDSSIRKFLINYPADNVIDIEKKKGLQNIGIGCIIVPNVLGKFLILTQKVASFYFKTDKNKNYYLLIDFVSIPKVNGSIKIEENIISSFRMQTLENKTVKVMINQNMIKKSISKISIQVDKCWFPNYLDLNIADFPLGVGITKISCN